MSVSGIDPRVLDALQNASSLELFQLSTLIGVISVFVPDRKVMEKSLFRTTT